MTMTDLQGRI